MWPSSCSPPPPGGRPEITLGAMFLECLLLDFLYLKMFSVPVQTHSYSSAAVCPQSSSCNSFSLPNPPFLLPLYPPQVLFVPDIEYLECHSVELSVLGPRTCWKNTTPPCWTRFQRLCMMRCVRLSASCFSQSLSLKQPLRASSPYCPCGYKLFLYHILTQGTSTRKWW